MREMLNSPAAPSGKAARRARAVNPRERAAKEVSALERMLECIDCDLRVVPFLKNPFEDHRSVLIFYAEFEVKN